MCIVDLFPKMSLSTLSVPAKRRRVAGNMFPWFLALLKARLRRTAMATPEDVVRNMLGDIKTRAQSIYDHDGGHIPKD